MYYPEREDFYETPEEVCSNFNGVINYNTVTELMNNNCKASYSAWEWHGYVWHQDGKFHIRVKRFGNVVGEYDYDTIEDLKSDVCDKHGDE